MCKTLTLYMLYVGAVSRQFAHWLSLYILCINTIFAEHLCHHTLSLHLLSIYAVINGVIIFAVHSDCHYICWTTVIMFAEHVYCHWPCYYICYYIFWTITLLLCVLNIYTAIYSKHLHSPYICWSLTVAFYHWCINNTVNVCQIWTHHLWCACW